MNAYSIEDLLIGRTYYSNSNRFKFGKIEHAEKRSDVYIEGGEAYLVQYYTNASIRPQYATIAVLGAN